MRSVSDMAGPSLGLGGSAPPTGGAGLARPGPGASPALAAGGAAVPRPPGATLDGAAGRAWRGQGRPEGVAERREYRTAGRNGPPLTLEGPGCYSPVCQQIGRAGWVQGSQPAAQRQGRSAPRADLGHRPSWPAGLSAGRRGAGSLGVGTSLTGEDPAMAWVDYDQLAAVYDQDRAVPLEALGPGGRRWPPICQRRRGCRCWTWGPAPG